MDVQIQSEVKYQQRRQWCSLPIRVVEGNIQLPCADTDELLLDRWLDGPLHSLSLSRLTSGYDSIDDHPGGDYVPWRPVQEEEDDVDQPDEPFIPRGKTDMGAQVSWTQTFG